ncbi:MAG: MFS transporter [Chloroflexi bacterium]|nr:MFS transporter [Chloroflexota bacterium]
MLTEAPAKQTAIDEKRPSKLFNRNYVLLWQGQTVSRLGNQAFSIALALWIKQATGSATLMGLILMFSALPAVLLGPLAGAVADRYKRRTIIILSDLIGGIAVLILAGVMLTAPEATNLTLAVLFVVSILLAVITTFFHPAIAAAIPDLVPEDRLSSANALGQVSFQLTVFIGQGIGGTLYRILGAPILFLIDGLTYLFSAVSESFITIPQTVPEKIPGWRDNLRAFKKDIILGFRYVWRTPGLRELVLASTLLNFFMTPILILLPFYVEDFLRVKPDWYGFLLASYGLGSMLGFVLAGALPLSGRKRSWLIVLFIIVEPLGYVALGVWLNPWIALGMTLIGGLISGFVMVYVTTILQLTTPGDIRGRVFGLLGTLAGALTPLAMGAAGIIADLTGQNIPLIYIACGVMAALLAILMSLKSDFRDYLAYEK